MPKQTSKKIHEPVLLSEVVELLSPKTGDTYLDLTAGYGGHANAIMLKTRNLQGSCLVDRDSNAIEYLSTKFAEVKPSLIKSDFLSALEDLVKQGKKFDVILADLGISSPHIDNASRGFSFEKEGPLDMRMDQSAELTAEQIVNSYSESDLAMVISKYGEDPKARRLAKEIISNRPIKTTTELAKVIYRVWPAYMKGKPVSRTFQALRIEVNHELEQIEKALPLMLDVLNEQGRVGIITFHSLEDRIVKQFFKEHSGDRYDADLNLLTKRPVTASDNELVFNPRSRSAKLRVAVKIKTKK